MGYIEEFKSVLFGYARDIQKYISGDKADYFYCAEKSEDRGTFDRNYKSRSRLCYALLYDVCEVPDKKAVVRELFLEELKDRENNSFQGIGDNLETLTSMLLELGEPADSELFERAQNANFDCACGYEPRVFKTRPLDEFSLYDCINALSDWGERELMFKLTDEFKSVDLDLKGLEELRSIAKGCTKRDCDREFAVTKLYEIFQKSSVGFDKYSSFSAVCEYTELLLEKGDLKNAADIFNEQAPLLSSYGRSYYVLGANLIAGGAAVPEKIWADILPHIKEDMKRNMVAPINRDTILSAAKIAGDDKMFKKLEKYFHER